MKVYGLNYEDALARARMKRPTIEPNEVNTQPLDFCVPTMCPKRGSTRDTVGGTITRNHTYTRATAADSILYLEP